MNIFFLVKGISISEFLQAFSSVEIKISEFSESNMLDLTEDRVCK